MRFIATIVIWIVLVGGLYGYTEMRDASRSMMARESPQLTRAAGVYSVSLTPTFSIERDPFALTAGSDGPGGFELWLNGREIDVDESKLQQGGRLILENITGLVEGGNELYVKASPPVSAEVESYAVRLQLLENDAVIAEQTLWGNRGSLVSGTLSFFLEERAGDKHDH